MIYYFSGTGNTHIVTIRLSLLLAEYFKKITDVNPLAEVPEGEGIGFIFPVYSWGVAPIMRKFIEALPETFWEEVKLRQLPVWGVMTCGDEVAMAPEMFKKILGRKGIVPESIWSVIMPNNYVLLPGFDVDPRNIEDRKLAEADGRMMEIVRGISQHRKTVDVVRGSWPRLKTRLVYPLFCRWGIFTKKWHSTLACVGCGICAKACPLHNIAMEPEGEQGSGKRGLVPQWGTNCCSCLACYHKCPRHAVAYGKVTQSKGQYFAH